MASLTWKWKRPLQKMESVMRWSDTWILLPGRNYNQSLNTDVFLVVWKKLQSFLEHWSLPIGMEGRCNHYYPQKTQRLQVQRSYRPISFLNCLGKMLECIINKRFMCHMESNDIITKEQSAYRINHNIEKKRISSCNTHWPVKDFQ